MTFDEFYDQYQPIENELGDEGFLFETYGVELEYVQKVPNNTVWTLVEVDGVLYLILYNEIKLNKLIALQESAYKGNRESVKKILNKEF